jgi:hypothetical protein
VEEHVVLRFLGLDEAVLLPVMEESNSSVQQ